MPTQATKSTAAGQVSDVTTETATMPVEIQYTNGSTAGTEAVFNGSQMYAASIQLGRVIFAREDARPWGGA